MKKNLTKKLMLSVLTLAFAVVSLGASTFAWFTMSSTAKVSAFEGAVKGAEGVEIAITKLGWNGTPDAAEDVKYDSLKWFSGQLPADQFTADIIDPGFAFSALTSDGKGTFTDVSNNTVDASHENAGKASGGYIGFRLWFKSAANDTLKLTDIVISNKTNANPVVMDQAFEIAAPKVKDGTEYFETIVGQKWTFDVVSAARISLHAQGKTDALIYESDYLAPTAPGDSTPGTAGNSTGYSEKGAYAYYNLKAIDRKLGSVLTAPTTSQIGSLADTGAGSVDVVSLTSNTPTYVDVYVWIEGWDGECLNAIFTQELVVNFDFALASKYNN